MTPTSRSDQGGEIEASRLKQAWMFMPRSKRSRAGARTRRQRETPTRSSSTATRWSGSRSPRPRLRGTCAGSAAAQPAQVRRLLSCGTTWRVASGRCTTSPHPPRAGATMKMPSARARSLLYSTRSRAIALVVSRACPRISDGAEEHDTRRNSNTPRETRTPTPHKRDKAQSGRRGGGHAPGAASSGAADGPCENQGVPAGAVAAAAPAPWLRELIKVAAARCSRRGAVR